MKHVFAIKGLDCPCCSNSLEVYLKKTSGYDDLQVSFLTARLTLTSDEDEELVLVKLKGLMDKAPVYAQILEVD